MDPKEGSLEQQLRDVLHHWELERQTVKALREQMKQMLLDHQARCAELEALLKGRGLSVATARNAYESANLKMLDMLRERDATIAKLQKELDEANEKLHPARHWCTADDLDELHARLEQLKRGD